MRTFEKRRETLVLHEKKAKKAMTFNEEKPRTTLASSLRKVPLELYCVVLVVAAAPTCATLLLTSGMTPIGGRVYVLLGAGGVDGLQLFNGALRLGVVAALAGYVADVHLWRGVWAAAVVVYKAVAAACMVAGALGYTASMPSLPVLLGMATTFLSVACLRHMRPFASRPAEEFGAAASLALLTLALGLAVSWTAWVASPVAGRRGRWSLQEVILADQGFQPLTGFVVWGSPVLLAAAYTFASLLILIRSHLHVPDDLHAPLDKQEVDDVRREVKSLAACLGFTAASAWVSASLAADDFGMAEAVIRLSLATLSASSAYAIGSVGFERLLREVEANALVRDAEALLASDWCKGLAALLLWPAGPPYFALEALHQVARRRAPVDDGRDVDAEPAWFSREARGLFRKLQEWEWASVLSKATLIGSLLYGLQVGSGKGVPLLLSWLKVEMAAWPFPAVLSALFGSGLVMFMVPTIPGLPIYLLAGVIVTERCASNGLGFQVGCLLAIAFSFVLKMTACALQMKCVGGPFSRSVAVKKFIGVHKPAMKAIRYILSQDGLRLSKVAVLVGGPDWPTYVLTGILDLRLLDILMGSLPHLAVIAPFVLTSAFATRAGRESDVERAEFSQYLSNVMAVVSSLILLGVMIFAGYAIQATMEEHRDDLDGDRFARDDQENDVLRQVRADELKARRTAGHTAWRSMPCWLQSCLLLGTGLSTLMVHTLLEPLHGHEAFRDFKLTDNISSLPGGSPLGVVRPLGWLGLGCFFASCSILVVHSVWRSARAGRPEEESPLLSESNSALARCIYSDPHRDLQG